MTTLIIHPKNKKQFAALKGLFKAFNIPFEARESPYDPEFVKKIKQGDEDLKAGKGVIIDVDNLFVGKVEKGWKMLKRAGCLIISK